MILNLLASACPLILCSIGALFSEYAGVLALFLEGLISFSAFTVFTVAFFTGSTFLGFVASVIICVAYVFVLGLIIEKMKGQMFIAAISMNLLFSALISLFSNLVFGTRGVLTSSPFEFDVVHVQIFTIFFTVFLVAGGILFLRKSKLGLYIRVTGPNPDVLLAKGVNPLYCRLAAWSFSAIYGAIAGGLLVVRLSSFVPNISSGRGWMALATVFLGNKNPKKIIFAVFIFCMADILSSNIQNLIPAIPSSIILSLPYVVVLLLIALKKE